LRRLAYIRLFCHLKLLFLSFLISGALRVYMLYAASVGLPWLKLESTTFIYNLEEPHATTAFKVKEVLNFDRHTFGSSRA
jgi:hypothetical protein